MYLHLLADAEQLKALCHEQIEEIRENKHDDANRDDSHCVLQQLLAIRPPNLLQLTPHFCKITDHRETLAFLDGVFIATQETAPPIPDTQLGLSGFPVNAMAVAESAILLQLEAIRVVLLVLLGRVVALLAIRASHGNCDAHQGTSSLHPQIPEYSITQPTQSQSGVADDT